MPFQKGDTVLYGVQGVCRIADIAEKEFRGVPARYYVLKPVYEKGSTLFVPVDHPELTGKMRRILSAREIEALIRSMPEKELLWIEEDAARAEEYRRVLSSGDRSALIQIIKTLYLRKQALAEKGRKLRTIDEHFFKEAENILYHEFALVLHITPEQVLPFIMEQIQLQVQNGG